MAKSPKKKTSQSSQMPMKNMPKSIKEMQSMMNTNKKKKK